MMEATFKIFGILLGIAALWIVLAVVEVRIVKTLDERIRQDRQVFFDYVERLPAVLDGTGKGRIFSCESHRVGLFWTYELCLVEYRQAGWMQECDAPFFCVKYHRPNIHLIPIPDELEVNIFDLQRNKDICEDYLAREN